MHLQLKLHVTPCGKRYRQLESLHCTLQNGAFLIHLEYHPINWKRFLHHSEHLNVSTFVSFSAEFRNNNQLKKAIINKSFLPAMCKKLSTFSLFVFWKPSLALGFLRRGLQKDPLRNATLSNTTLICITVNIIFVCLSVCLYVDIVWDSASPTHGLRWIIREIVSEISACVQNKTNWNEANWAFSRIWISRVRLHAAMVFDLFVTEEISTFYYSLKSYWSFRSLRLSRSSSSFTLCNELILLSKSSVCTGALVMFQAEIPKLWGILFSLI